MDFEEPIELLDPLLFVLHPMLDQLMLRARTHALALSRIDLRLTLDNGSDQKLTLRPAIPSEDKPFLLKLLHLELQAHPPQAAVKQLRLSAEAAATKKMQLGLFAPQLPESSRLDVTLARLRAIVGEDGVGSPVLQDNYCNDAFRMEPFVQQTRSSAAATRSSTTAMRQLRPPEPVTVSRQQGIPKQMRFRGENYRVTCAYGPWQSSGAWWSTTPWLIEQWDVIAEAERTAAMLACCLVHDRAQRCWQLDALYD